MYNPNFQAKDWYVADGGRIDSQRRWTFDLRVGDNEDTRTSDNIILSVY